MEKKIITILLSCLCILYLIGCTEPTPVYINVENKENLSEGNFCVFVPIGGDLVYDSVTRIVYIKNPTASLCYVYTAYYAPNGLPYRYNPETNTFEEINR